MCTEKSNSGVHVLVLARPADSVCAIMVSALCQWNAFSVYSTVYEVVNAIKDIPSGQLPVLIVRPAMLSSQAALFFEQHFPNLRTIGWVDSGEKMSDCAIAQATAKGMVLVSHPDQLLQIIGSFSETIDREHLVSNAVVMDIINESDQLEYELSNDEVNALLGVD